MNKAVLRKFHRYFALVISPFIIGISISGIILLLHHHDLIHFQQEFTRLIFRLHTWSYVSVFVGLIVPISLIILSISGIVLFLTTIKK